MKEVKIIKTKTAVIILSIVVLLLMIAVFNFFDKIYQKPTKTFPEISVYYKDKELGKMLPIKYEWKDRGEIKKLDLEIDNLQEYDFPKENIILVGTNEYKKYILKADFRYKSRSYSENLYKKSYIGAIGTGGADIDFSQELKRDFPLYSTDTIGEYIYKLAISYMQGTVTYAIKLVSFESDQVAIAKNYLNTKLTENKKIEELISKIKFGTMLNSVKLDGDNLTIEYEAHIGEDSEKMNNLILFTCIPELESITYSPKNKKTYSYDAKEEIDKCVYTREEINNEKFINIEHLKKFMEQI